MAKLTVLMTVYNGMPYLPLAIESILDQSFQDYEFLIVNDCSTDDTRNVVLSYQDPRIRLVDNDANVGQTRSINIGLECTHTELVARMDADDISHPSRLETQVGFLGAHPEVAVVGSNMHQIDARGRVLEKLVRPQQNHQIRWMQHFENPIAGGAAVFRKSVVWDELGGFDSSIRFSQDWELLWRIPKQYELASIPQILLDARSHAAAANTAMLGEVYLEIQRIYRANIPLVLGFGSDSHEWTSRIDMLTDGAVRRRIEHPSPLLELIGALFERFSALYPEAVDDPVVLDILSTQYFRVVEWSRLRSPSAALRALRMARKITPAKRYLEKLLRAAAGLAGGREIRNWYRRARIELLS